MTKLNTMVLKFSGDITLEEIFQKYQTEIYDTMVKSIVEHLEKKTSEEVKVVTITINSKEYSVTLGKEKFYSALSNAIAYYERFEEYEKCQYCLNILKSMGYEKAEIVRTI